MKRPTPIEQWNIKETDINSDVHPKNEGLRENMLADLWITTEVAVDGMTIYLRTPNARASLAYGNKSGVIVVNYLPNHTTRRFTFTMGIEDLRPLTDHLCVVPRVLLGDILGMN